MAGYSRPESLRRDHGLAGFSCGEPSLDRWLHTHARAAEAAGTARVFVTVGAGLTVAGFHALAAGSVRTPDATARLMAGQPLERPVPVILLARLAVDQRHQGRGVGRSLLQDALLRCCAAAEMIGARAVAVHAIDEDARRWYLRWGFEPSPSDAHHLILLMKDLRKLFGGQPRGGG